MRSSKKHIHQFIGEKATQKKYQQEQCILDTYGIGQSLKPLALFISHFRLFSRSSFSF
jgi:hypothetical protein